VLGGVKRDVGLLRGGGARLQREGNHGGCEGVGHC
jgi:hypothetical protein